MDPPLDDEVSQCGIFCGGYMQNLDKPFLKF